MRTAVLKYLECNNRAITTYIESVDALAQAANVNMRSGSIDIPHLRMYLDIQESLVPQAYARSTRESRSGKNYDAVHALNTLSQKDRHDGAGTIATLLDGAHHDSLISTQTESQILATESQPYYGETQLVADTTAMRTMTRRSTRSQKTQEDPAQEDVALESVQEGDTNFLDLVSSFIDKADGFSPTQTQPQASLYPESQRFAKTPATAGKKRDSAGNVIATPAVSRNPFATFSKPTVPMLGLSQVFENTQAASSPFANITAAELRSDLPSPGIHLERHAQHAVSSSPMRPISAYKKGGVEPASKYIPSSESQQRRSTSRDMRDDGGLSQRSNESDWEDNGHFVREQKKKQRDTRAKAQFEAVSSPLSPAITMERQQSPPSSPPRVSEQIIPDDEECDLDPTQTQYVESNPAGAAPDVAEDTLELDTDPITIPETSIRPVPLPSHPQQLTQPSPSMRHIRATTLPEASEASSNDPIRIANSQRSRPSTQQQGIGLPQISSLDSIELIPASPEYDSERDEQVADALDTRHEKPIPLHNNPPPERGHRGGLSASRIPETSSVQNNHTTQEQTKFSSAVEMQPPPSSKDYNHSSQPVHVPEQRRKRKRMEDISQEDDIPPVTQVSSFDVLDGILALDDDPEAAKALATSPLQPVSTRKRVRLNDEKSHGPTTSAMELVLARIHKSNPILHEAFQPAEKVEVGDAEAELEIGQEDDLDDQPDVTGRSKYDADAGEERGHENGFDEATVAERSTPERRPVKSSRWDLGDSPKARFVIDRSTPRIQPPPETLRQAAAKRSRQKKSATEPDPPSAPALTQEHSSSAPPAGSMSTGQMTPSEVTSEIVAPSMILAHYYDGKSKYYPAKCLGPGDGDKLPLQWPGYDPEEISAQNACSFDLRIGDQVKVEIDGFPKTHFVVESLQGKQEVHKEDLITDIYGHTHVILRHKSAKVTYPKGYTAQSPIPVANVSIDITQWRRTSQRPNVFGVKKEILAASDSAYSTPPPRTVDLPMTPSSHRRNLIKKENTTLLVRRAGILSNMAFALSYVDDGTRQKYAKIIAENGGVVLENGFQDLFDDKETLKPAYANYGFTASLSNSHAAKAKHMQALALGLPCLSGKWVDASLAGGKPEPWEDYLLPAGESLDLDRAVKSRILALPNFDQFSLPDVLEQRKHHFDGSLVLFIKRKSDKERAYLFLAQKMSSVPVEEVVDLKAAKARIAELKEPGTIWLLVERGAAVAAEGLVQSLTQKTYTKKRRSKDRESDSQLQVLDIRVVDSETIKQTLIMGRLSVHNQQ